MDWLEGLYAFLDPFLILPYRLPENAAAGFFLGTFLLAWTCIFAGEISVRAILGINARYYGKLRRRTVRMHNLSVRAILAKDKESYRACNREANEAFGRYFFSQFAMGAGAFWPIPFALGWMAVRFEGIPFALPFRMPGIGDSVGYVGIFALLYLLNRMIWRRVPKKRPPGLLDSGEAEERMVSWADVDRHKGFPAPR
ncbi:MAG: hypothetical protein ACLFRG_11820 [Desulfococcaceae bacterium]